MKEPNICIVGVPEKEIIFEEIAEKLSKFYERPTYKKLNKLNVGRIQRPTSRHILIKHILIQMSILKHILIQMSKMKNLESNKRVATNYTQVILNEMTRSHQKH